MCMHKVKLLCLCSNCDYSQYCLRGWAVILSGENLCPTSWNYCKWPDSAEEPLSHDPLRLTSFDPGEDRCSLTSHIRIPTAWWFHMQLRLALRTRSWNSCMTWPYSSSSLLATRALTARACLITRRWTSLSSLWEKIGRTISIFTYNQYRLSSGSKILQQDKIADVNSYCK